MATFQVSVTTRVPLMLFLKPKRPLCSFQGIFVRSLAMTRVRLLIFVLMKLILMSFVPWDSLIPLLKPKSSRKANNFGCRR
ncbi:MAG: hypothetical protein [Microviridae sp.]|nr:MAG: hypothetical protein [Microviridae sp.]